MFVYRLHLIYFFPCIYYDIIMAIKHSYFTLQAFWNEVLCVFGCIQVSNTSLLVPVMFFFFKTSLFKITRIFILLSCGYSRTPPIQEAWDQIVPITLQLLPKKWKCILMTWVMKYIRWTSLKEMIALVSILLLMWFLN